MAKGEKASLLPSDVRENLTQENQIDLSWRYLFYVNVFFSCVSFSIILPSLQPYLSRNGGSVSFYGLTVAIYSVGEMGGAVIFGKIYESLCFSFGKRGSKYALLLTITLGIAGSFLYVFGDVITSPWTIFWGRFLQGVWTGGKQVVEQTYLSENAGSRVTELTAELGTFAILGFVCGPSFGALFTAIDFKVGGVTIDALTAPGFFILGLCILIFGLVCVFFNPIEEGIRGDDGNGHVDYGKTTENYSSNIPQNEATFDPPSQTGLITMLVLFIVHFYSFAIQETITTPFVLANYGWDQASVNLLFVGVGVISLITSIGVKYASRIASDFDLLIVSLIIGLVGSLLLVDGDEGGQPIMLPLSRFYVGFVFITVAFPFGRNVSLSIFSKILGPTPQGTWFGYMFAAGALPRIVGPSWSLYALTLACKVEDVPCGEDGNDGFLRTWLEFYTTSGCFLLGLVLTVKYREQIKPYYGYETEF